MRGAAVVRLFVLDCPLDSGETDTVCGSADGVTAAGRAEKSLRQDLGEDWAQEREAPGYDSDVDLDASPHVIGCNIPWHLLRLRIILKSCNDDKYRGKADTSTISLILGIR